MLATTLRSSFPVLLIITSQVLIAQVKYSRVKIEIPGSGMETLLKLDLDLDHGEYNKAEKTFISVLHASDLQRLRESGIRFSILVDDEVANFQQTNINEQQNPRMLMQSGKLHYENSCQSHLSNISVPAGFVPGLYGGYYSFAQMQARIDSLVTHYPAIVQKTILPQTTTGGRPMIVVKISDNVLINENEPEALYTGLHHAREGMSMMNLFFFMQYLAENYASDAKVKELVDNRELFFIPCVNPDGYVYNELNTPGGGGMWRKNRRNNGGGNYGVDLNRNYNVDWGVSGPDINISTNPASDSYIGPSTFSEPETQAIRQFSQSRHLKIVIDHHAYGNYYVTPYGVPANHPFTSADAKFYKYASALMARYNGYFAGDGMATVNYYAVGNSRDYHMAGDIGIGNKKKTYGYTVEIGQSGLGFWPSQSNIIPIAKSMFFANMQMAYMAGSYYEIMDRDRMAIASAGGDFNFSLLRTGISNNPVTVNIIPLQNIQSIGTSFSNPGLTDYGDTIHGQISYTLSTGINVGEKVRFIYQVNSGGITLNDTIEKIYQPATLLYDNIEGPLTNWTLSANWGSSTTAAYEGNRSLSESPSGNYSSSNTSSATYKQSFDLTGATAAYLSFWMRHRSQNGVDKMQIQLSPTGVGAGATFSSVCGQQTIAENSSAPGLTGIRENWTRETVDLNDYLGATNLGIRFLFNSNSSETDDGFYIDNIELIKSNAIILNPVPLAIVPNQEEKNTSVSITVYPNPVSNKLLIRLYSDKTNKMDVTLSLVTGVKITGFNTVVHGVQHKEIDMSSLKNQVYILTIVNHKTGSRSVYKILRH